MQKRPNLMDYQKRDLDITKAQFDVFKSKPDNSKPGIELLDDFQKINEKRKDGVQAFIEGGIAGSKFFMKKELEGINRVNAWLQENLNARRQQTAWYEKQEQERVAIEPYASAAINLAYSGADSQTMMNNARGLFDLAAQSGLIKGRLVGVVPNSTIVNVQEDDGSIKAFDLATFAPEAAKAARDNQIKQLSLGIQKQNADAYGRSVDSNVALHNAQIDQMPQTMDVRQQEADTASRNSQTKFDALGIKSAKDIVPQLEAATFTEKIANDVIEDAKNHPDVFGNIFMNYINTGGDASTLNLLAQKAIDPKERDAYMRISKNLNALMVSDVKGSGSSGNMTIDKWIKESNPNMQFSKDNVISIVSNIRDKAKFTKDLRRELLGFPAGERIGQAYDKSVQNMPNKNVISPDGRIKVQDPSTGQIMQLSPQEAEIALSRGGVKVQ